MSSTNLPAVRDNEHEHESTLDKVKSLFHHSHPSNSSPAQTEEHHGHSAHARGFPDSEIREDVHRIREEHALTERKADERIHQRELSESLPSSFSDTKTTTTTTSDFALSSFSPRESLDQAAHHHHDEKHEPPAPAPDMDGFRHIPEGELHESSERSEHTALRPNDLRDPKSMDGAGDPTTAGDDLAI